jgi:hypothetical protein
MIIAIFYAHCSKNLYICPNLCGDHVYKPFFMRKKGNISLVKDARDRELYTVYIEVCKRHLSVYGRICQSAAIRETINHPSSRFYFSSERAERIIHLYRSGRRTTNNSPQARKCYEGLYKTFLAYISEHPDISRKRAIEDIINMPAPCFIICPRLAVSIISKMRILCRKELIRQLRH